MSYAVKVRIDKFSGTGKVFSREPDALAAIVRGLAIDNARAALEKSAVSQLTDNSGGTAVLNATAYVQTPALATVIDATSSGGSQTTNLTTSLGKIDNAYQVLSQSVNNAMARLGLRPIVNAYRHAGFGERHPVAGHLFDGGFRHVGGHLRFGARGLQRPRRQVRGNRLQGERGPGRHRRARRSPSARARRTRPSATRRA